MSIVTGQKASYYPMPADQFKAVAGEELTEMMCYFSDFGCESPLSPPFLLPAPNRTDRTPVHRDRLRRQGYRPLSKGLA